ncbi:hypothetical protein Sjap_022428 [Stephania japonica]|uniref:Fucosyltransferase n=1 Tax=Stephania japonica TaxID=461633 RepID=A0AAP0HUE8_9MAGN
MPFIVALVVFAEIAFLGRLDMAKNAAMVNTWTKSFYYGSSGEVSASEEEDPFEGLGVGDGKSGEVVESCEGWLEREDSVAYSRDFGKDPILVSGPDEEWKSCSVGCNFGSIPEKKPDASFGLLRVGGAATILRSMESSHYYAENNIAQARRRGYNVIMTTSLSSDVPVGYFSWAEYDIMAPLQPKTESALAAAFISNCGARNFRLQALELLEKSKIKIDSYGGCHRNRDGRVDKVVALKRYKFSLAFENSNEEDYVTEKFFQSLVAGAVPVVVGAPNILDFAPSTESLLHIKEVDDVASVAKAMLHLAEDPEAYNRTVRWKYDGPSDSFKALVDMAAVHSSCRLCIHLATKIRESEEKGPEFQKRPCKCTRGPETLYHLYVRERGRFEMESIFLSKAVPVLVAIAEMSITLILVCASRGHALIHDSKLSSNLTLAAMESAVLAKFKSANHVPVWKEERPKSIRGGDELKVHRIHPVGLTQREALYTFRFNSNDGFRSYIDSHPCAKFEVIFV